VILFWWFFCFWYSIFLCGPGSYMLWNSVLDTQECFVHAPKAYNALLWYQSHNCFDFGRQIISDALHHFQKHIFTIWHQYSIKNCIKICLFSVVTMHTMIINQKYDPSPQSDHYTHTTYTTKKHQRLTKQYHKL